MTAYVGRLPCRHRIQEGPGSVYFLVAVRDAPAIVTRCFCGCWAIRGDLGALDPRPRITTRSQWRKARLQHGVFLRWRGGGVEFRPELATRVRPSYEDSKGRTTWPHAAAEAGGG